MDGWKLAGTGWPRLTEPHGAPLSETWAELVARFEAPVTLPAGGADHKEMNRRKATLTGWSAARFEGDNRSTDTLIRNSALVLDLDADPAKPPPGCGEPAITPDRLRALLTTVLGVTAWAAHTTAQSAPGAWRWRVVVPLAEPLDRAAYVALVDLLRRDLLTETDAPLTLEGDAGANRDAARLWYAPARLPERPDDYATCHADGIPLDGGALLDGCAARERLTRDALATRLENDCEAKRKELADAWQAAKDAAEKADKAKAKAAADLARWHVSAVLARMNERPALAPVAPLPGGWGEAQHTAVRDGADIQPEILGGTPVWAGLRRTLPGWWADTVAVLVGHTGRGKSSFALQIAEQAARDGAPVLYASMEMSAEELVARLLAVRGGKRASWSAIKRGAYPPESVATAGASLVADAPHLYLWAPEGEGRNAEALGRMARAASVASGGRPPLVVLDYVQRVTGGTPEEDRRGAVAALSGKLRDLSRPADGWPGCAILALSSTARAHYADFNTTDDLAGAYELEGSGKESGELEFDAPILLCMTSDKPHDNAGEPENGRLALVRVVKNREGSTGSAWMRFAAARGVFTETTAPPPTEPKPKKPKGIKLADLPPGPVRERLPEDPFDPDA